MAFSGEREVKEKWRPGLMSSLHVCSGGPHFGLGLIITGPISGGSDLAQFPFRLDLFFQSEFMHVGPMKTFSFGCNLMLIKS